MDWEAAWRLAMEDLSGWRRVVWEVRATRCSNLLVLTSRRPSVCMHVVLLWGSPLHPFYSPT